MVKMSVKALVAPLTVIEAELRADIIVVARVCVVVVELMSTPMMLFATLEEVVPLASRIEVVSPSAALN